MTVLALCPASAMLAGGRAHQLDTYSVSKVPYYSMGLAGTSPVILDEGHLLRLLPDGLGYLCYLDVCRPDASRLPYDSCYFHPLVSVIGAVSRLCLGFVVACVRPSEEN